jgi:GAF domain-containing protein
MISAPRPENESERLAALHAYELLDTAPEPEFDAITESAARLSRTPIALISLVDDERQFFKSERGLGLRSTDRASSFCAHAILQPDEMFEIPNALDDARFFDNPLVTGFPGIRVYAGIALVDRSGIALGTLCVIGREPRTLSEMQRLRLRSLATSAMYVIATRTRPSEIERHERILAESRVASVALRDRSGLITAGAADAGR